MSNSIPHEHPIDASTRYCAVLGCPIRHSASPALQNAGIAALRLNWRYLALAVEPERLPEVLKGASSMGFVGLNLTVPHKILAMELVDELDGSARQWGAVNTIKFEAETSPGTWTSLAREDPPAGARIRSVGYNTDADAIVRSLQEDLELTLEGSSAVVLGAGGAGAVAAQRLAMAGVDHLYLVNRTVSKAEKVASLIRAHNPSQHVEVGYPPPGKKVGLILNATSLGLKTGDPIPWDPGVLDLRQASHAYDMIYRPAETPFLQTARETGCRVANGMGMLLYQGARALEIWSGQPAPVETMRNALRRHLETHP